MATYRFRVWPNGSAPYIVTGNGMSWIYAKENVARREGVDLFDVMPVNGNAPIDDDSLSSSNSKNNISNPIGTIILLGILLFFWCCSYLLENNTNLCYNNRDNLVVV